VCGCGWVLEGRYARKGKGKQYTGSIPLATRSLTHALSSGELTLGREAGWRPKIVLSLRGAHLLHFHKTHTLTTGQIFAATHPNAEVSLHRNSSELNEKPPGHPIERRPIDE
jgi:hypothetical protein